MYYGSKKSSLLQSITCSAVLYRFACAIYPRVNEERTRGNGYCWTGENIYSTNQLLSYQGPRFDVHICFRVSGYSKATQQSKDFVGGSL